MKFNFFQPTNICFGTGQLSEIGKIVSQYGSRCLLVTGKSHSLAKAIEYTKQKLREAGISVEHFNEVIPNPTTECITEGAQIAHKHHSEIILGMGGGSSIDTAKAIAVEATHPGSCWEYRWCSTMQPTTKTLPVIAVTTTSGTGAHLTQVAVITNSALRDKSAIYNSFIYPKVAIVDPSLMLSSPSRLTAASGFDVFAHAFESILHPSKSPYTELLAWEALQLTVKYLPLALANGNDINIRTQLALADTFAGICIANAGVTLPHGMGMAIGGLYPHIMHGETLSIVYPSFIKFSWETAISSFARLTRIINPETMLLSDNAAAKRCAEEVEVFLKKINMRFYFSDFEVAEKDLHFLAGRCMVLPDYKNNPRVASEAEMEYLLKQCYK